MSAQATSMLTTKLISRIAGRLVALLRAFRCWQPKQLSSMTTVIQHGVLDKLLEPLRLQVKLASHPSILTGDPIINAAAGPANGANAGGTLTLTVTINVSNAKTVRIYYYYRHSTHADAWNYQWNVCGKSAVQQTSGRCSQHTFGCQAQAVTEALLITAVQLQRLLKHTGVYGYRSRWSFALSINGVSAPTVPSHASSLSAGPDTGFSIVKWTAGSSSYRLSYPSRPLNSS